MDDDDDAGSFFSLKNFSLSVGWEINDPEKPKGIKGGKILPRFNS